MGKHTKRTPKHTEVKSTRLHRRPPTLEDAAQPSAKTSEKRGGRQRIPVFSTIWVALALAVALYFHFGQPPLVAIPSGSMLPTFHVGDLVRIKPIQPPAVKTGDIVVVNLPAAIQSQYNYPASVIHRVVSVNRSGGQLSFRTKGDNNANQDPYTITPSEIGGIEAHSYRYLGYPIVFFHSRQGRMLALALLVIYGLFLISGLTEGSGRKARKHLSALVNADVIERLDEIEQQNDVSFREVTHSLQAFASAMQTYATHLESHTASVQGMALSADALRQAAQLQARLLQAVSTTGDTEGIADLLQTIRTPGTADVTMVPAPTAVRTLPESKPSYSTDANDFETGNGPVLQPRFLLPDEDVESEVRKLRMLQGGLKG